MLRTRLEIGGTKASSCFPPISLLPAQPSIFQHTHTHTHTHTHIYIYNLFLPRHKGDVSPPAVNIVSVSCLLLSAETWCLFVLTCTVTCLPALLLFSRAGCTALSGPPDRAVRRDLLASRQSPGSLICCANSPPFPLNLSLKRSSLVYRFAAYSVA